MAMLRIVGHSPIPSGLGNPGMLLILMEGFRECKIKLDKF